MTPKAFGRRVALAALLLCANPAYAHGFGQRFVLPLPLWLWVVGAGLTIVLTFVVMAVFVRERAVRGGHWRIDVLHLPGFGWLGHPAVLTSARAFGAAFFVVVALAGLFGRQDPYTNIITTFVWVTWWVGFAFVCALIGNVWELFNPLRTVFALAERIYHAATGRLLARGWAYPPGLGVWPAVVLFFLFAWGELIWGTNDVPRNLALAMMAYALVTWAAMFVWGRETWLAHGEAFTIAFGVLARFAPLAAERGPAGEPHLWLQPFGAGLLATEGVRVSFLVFVLLMLATVTFDGFLETPAFQALINAVYGSRELATLLFRLSDIGISDLQLMMTAALVAFPLLFLVVFWIASWAMVEATSRLSPSAASADPQRRIAAAACAFVLTLVPIAVAYHLSHYFSLLLTAGQFIIPLLSDPFGWCWDLLGTKDYRVDIGIVSPYVFWYGATTIIVIGHVIAVYLAHVEARAVFQTRHAALVSQVPMVILMVAYTMTSLWILAQPVVR